MTRDEIVDPHRLTLRLSVNDVERQQGTTADMIFSVPQLVAYASQFMSLAPGDVILEIAGKPVNSAGDVRSAVTNARRGGKRSVMMHVQSGKTSRFVAIPVG